MKKEEECSFCYQNKHRSCSIKGLSYKEFFESEYFIVILSLFPVTTMHFLIISKRHFEKATDMMFSELQDFQFCRMKIENYYREQGINSWNSGDNYGKIAGQSIAHFHYHYFDRREGDVENPRGGIRNFMPPLEELGDYKDETNL